MSIGAKANPQSEYETTHEKETLAREEASSSKKGRGLLRVPSRSSSHKAQSSPTSGFSGLTASESRDSIGRRSKDSTNSMAGRRRNGSASSHQSGAATAANNTPGSTQPNSPAGAPQKRKKGGLLAMLGCCVMPDHGNALEGGEEPPHKLDKIPQRQLTSSRRTMTPSGQTTGSKTQLPEEEKDTQSQATPSQDKEKEKAGKRASGPAAPEPPAASESASDSKQTTLVGASGPSITVNPPVAETEAKDVAMTDAPAAAKDEDEDVAMPEADAAHAAVPVPAPAEEETQKSVPLPPPVPVAAPSPPATEVKTPEAVAAEQASQPKALLPPIEPHMKGRKCLVLDLDETLVHSSFKILHQADFTIPVEIEGNYHNVYVIKRPGVDQFMKRVGELYEVVVFTASVSKYGDPLLDQLDIHKVVHHRLFRESCYNHQGNYVKDLSQVGRDLKDTIIIDNSPTSYIFHPQHAVPISSWFSDAHDNELLDLIPVLEDLAHSDVQDVSLVLDVTL